jgi:alpha-tubulin suppressor-like RCC1 family protein
VGGRAHTLVLSKPGGVYSFGSDDCGQLGQPQPPAYNWPLGPVEDLRHRRVVQVAAGGECNPVTHTHPTPVYMRPHCVQGCAAGAVIAGM